MTDDFSNLETNASCYTINSTTSIYAYRNNTRSTYTQIGGKWFKSTQSTYTNIPTGSVCYSYSDITGLNSNAVYYPFFVAIAFSLAVFVFLFAFKVFWDNLVRWRI